MCEDSALLGPLPTPASRGEEAKAGSRRFEQLNILMDRNLIPAALVMAGGIVLWLAIFPSLFCRKGSGDSQIFESLLARVHQLRQGQFPVRYSNFSAVKIRAKLLVEARERLRHEKEFLRQRR